MRIIRLALFGLIAFVLVAAALVGYFVYTPEPEPPQLSGTLTKGSIDVQGLTRTYSTYVPRGLPKGAPLVLLMHGSGENGGRMRRETGYGFERLADRHQFAVAYPNAYGSGDWNACGTVGSVSANGVEIDDVAFLSDLARKLTGELATDPARTFAVGSSRGGFMAFRLALESPSVFRAVAAVSANVHTRDNFKCTPAPGGTASVMILNGTKDPIVPFDGGSVSVLGFSYRYGTVMSSLDSAQYFADLNHIDGAPTMRETAMADGVRVKDFTWQNKTKTEVELVVVEGGGHGIPQPYRRHPRLLGPSPKEPNGPEVIWAFLQRQASVR